MTRKKSDSEKKLSGTFRKDRSRKIERGEMMAAENIPDPAEYLSVQGNEVYYHVCDFLNYHGLLNDVVAKQVNIYASLAQRYEENEILLKKEGEVKEIYAKDGRFLNYQANPRAKISTQLSRSLLSIGKQLLLCPVDHDKLPDPPIEEDNYFANL